MKKTAVRFFLFLAAVGLCQAEPAGKTSIAVYPIKAVGAVDQALAATLSSLMGYQLAQSQKLLVIDESMLKIVMERQALNISDACDDTFCQVAIGKLVQAQKMVVGNISKLGSRYILTFKLIDIQSGALDGTFLDQCACTEDQLDQLVAAAGAKIRNHFGEAVPIPQLPSAGVSQPLPAMPPTPGTRAPAPPPLATPTPATSKEDRSPGTKGGPMVLVKDFNFYIDKYEVTNLDYQECESDGVCKKNKIMEGFNQPQQPVIGVDRKDAETYCQWAGKRLPTDQEWTQAAGGTDGRKYPWGSKQPNCNVANFVDCKLIGKTLIVGSMVDGASPYGALDMAGNVWEWVGDKEIVRGGSWAGGPKLLEVTSQIKASAESRNEFFGFRCAR